MNLHNSVTPIIEALDRAKERVPKDWHLLEEDRDIAYQVMEMQYLPKPLCDHLGVSKDIFPAAPDLEDEEIKIIVEKINEVWAAYNYVADFPDDVQFRIAYESLLSVWDKTVACYPFGTCHFDFYDLEFEQYEEIQ